MYILNELSSYTMAAFAAFMKWSLVCVSLYSVSGSSQTVPQPAQGSETSYYHIFQQMTLAGFVCVCICVLEYVHVFMCQTCLKPGVCITDTNYMVHSPLSIFTIKV